MSDELPGGWAPTTLGALLQGGVFADGDWVESKDQDPEGDVRLIQLADVGDGSFRDRSARFLTSSKAAELGCTFLEPGDVLIARMPEPLGRACVFPGASKRCVTVVDVCIARPHSMAADARWLMHAINAPQFRAQMEEFERGTTRKRISRGNLSLLPLRVPPLMEQRRIAAKIDALLERVMGARERLENMPALLRRVRRAVLAIVSGDSRADEEQWEQVCFGDLLIGDGPQNGLYKPQSAYGDGVSIVRIDDFHDGVLKPVSSLRRLRLESGEVEKYGLREGEILINRVNSLKFLGKAVMVPSLDQPLVFESNMMRCRVDERRLIPAFALLYLLSPRGTAALRVNAKHAVNQASINQQDVTGLVIPLPPVDVQTAIVAQVQHLLAAVERIERAVTAALALAGKVSQAVLQRAFSGELVPTEAALALAEGRGFETAEQMLLRSPERVCPLRDRSAEKVLGARKTARARAAPRGG